MKQRDNITDKYSLISTILSLLCLHVSKAISIIQFTDLVFSLGMPTYQYH